jgi:hypothetical protein
MRIARCICLMVEWLKTAWLLEDNPMFKSVRFAARQLFVRSNLNAAPLSKSIRDIVTSINRSQPVFDARPMMDRVHELGTQRLLSFLFFVMDSRASCLARQSGRGFSRRMKSNSAST